ncbi:hypothetical protein BH11MYX4_BH11MYX4_52570 [soil metagenome]
MALRGRTVTLREGQWWQAVMMKPATKATPQRGMSMRRMGFSKGAGDFEANHAPTARWDKPQRFRGWGFDNHPNAMPRGHAFATAMSC